jgi:hypothetical protein
VCPCQISDRQQKGRRCRRIRTCFTYPSGVFCRRRARRCFLLPKVYKYKVVSTIFNDDIYGIEIIYLQERLHVLCSWHPSHGQLGLMVLPPAHNYYIGCRATIAPKGLLLWMSAVIYSKISI